MKYTQILFQVFMKGILYWLTAAIILSIAKCSEHKGYVKGYKEAVQGCVDTLEAR